MTDYTVHDFPTKKALRTALAEGQLIKVITLSPVGDKRVWEGPVSLSGPHYPRPHTWYAEGLVQEGYLFSIDGMTQKQRVDTAALIWERIRLAREAAFRAVGSEG